MSYIQDNLMPKEKILFSARVHKAVFLPAVISLIASIAFLIYALRTASQKTETSGITAGFLIFIFVMFFFYSIGLGLQALITLLTTEFAITNRRVIAKTGFIHRRTLEMLLPKVESVAVYQNILGRLLNFGNVTIVGTGGTRETFRAIVEPVAVRSQVNQIIERYMQAYAEYQQQRAFNPRAGG
jgi:uncharacterized membrane protein YdbT with pleckstrin-like domain